MKVRIVNGCAGWYENKVRQEWAVHRAEDVKVLEEKEMARRILFNDKPVILADYNEDKNRVLITLLEREGFRKGGFTTDIAYSGVYINDVYRGAGVLGLASQGSTVWDRSEKVSFIEFLKEILGIRPEAVEIGSVTENYGAAVYKDGTVKVGCQSTNIEKLKEIIKAYEGLNA